MKRCPQCHSLYEDATQFCLKDGQPLVGDAPPDADFEEDTVIRHDPIIVDFNQPETVAYQVSPPVNQPTIIVEKQRNAGKYLLFLVIGLLLGGGLVLITLLIAGNLNRDKTSVKVDAGDNRAERIVSNQNSSVSINADTIQNNANAVETSPVHAGKTSAADGDFNGRVITLNAYVRAAPSKSAVENSILPKDDRIKIGARENANSPWFRVTCEHGAAGWMHGDTIEFTE